MRFFISTRLPHNVYRLLGSLTCNALFKRKCGAFVIVCLSENMSHRSCGIDIGTFTERPGVYEKGDAMIVMFAGHTLTFGFLYCNTFTHVEIGGIL